LKFLHVDNADFVGIGSQGITLKNHEDNRT